MDKLKLKLKLKRKERRLDEGFGVGVVLYLLVLAGIAGSVLFSGYSQSLRNNAAVLANLQLRNDLLSMESTFSAVSVLSRDGTKLCPPGFAYLDQGNSSFTADCPDVADDPSLVAGTVPTPVGLAPFSSVAAERLPGYPDGYASLEVYLKGGGAVDVGVVLPSVGGRQLDPWGRYYIVCRWVNSTTDAPDTNNAFRIISAGQDGVLKTNCANDVDQSDHQTSTKVAAAVNRASVWQVAPLGTSGAVQATYSAQGVAVDSSGNLNVPGTLKLSTIGTSSSVSITNSDGNLRFETGGLILDAGNISLLSGAFTATGGGTFGGDLVSLGSVAAATAAFTGGVNAGSITGGTLSVGTGSSFTVDGEGNIEASGAAEFGALTTSTVTAGTTSVGALTATSATIAGTVVAGDASVGALSATSANVTGAASAASVSSTTGTIENLTVTNLIVTGSSTGVTGTGDLSEATGQLNLSTQVTGTLAIAHGGTGATTWSGALANLGGNNASNITTGTLGYQRLDSSGINKSGGPYNRVWVDAYGRVTDADDQGTGGSGGDELSDSDGDSIKLATGTIIIKISDIAKGLWDATGLTVGSGGSPRAVLDMGYDKGAVLLPVGSSADQPLLSLPGMMRYNSSLGAFEGYMGSPAAWRLFTSGGAVSGSFDGICGPDNGATALTQAPVRSTMCTSGVIGPLLGTGNPGWEWTCAGIGTGATVSCSALAAKIDAACGSDSNAVLSRVPVNLCTSGTPTDITDSHNQWSWGCYGAAGGTSLSCYAFPNGLCSPKSNNLAINEAPIQEKGCTFGILGNLVTTVDTLTTWTWTCYGGTGGTNDQCTATQTVNGSCGTAHDTVISATPTGTAACASGTMGAISGTPGTTFVYWNCNPNGIGTVASCAAYAPPAAYSFTNVTGATPGTAVVSNAVPLSGAFANATATCSGACIDILKNGTSCGGTTCSGFNPGDSIAIKVNASSTVLTTVTASATVGTRSSGTWAVKTLGGIPNAFAFTNQTDILPGTDVLSNTVTLSGTFENLGATCTGTGCQLSQNGGAWASSIASGINPGDTIRLRQTASSTAAGWVTTTATATVGSVAGGYVTSSNWTVRTSRFLSSPSLPTDATITSNTATLSGGNFTNLTATCGTNCTGVSVNGGAFGMSVSGVNPGSTIAIQMTNPSTTSKTATVSIGSYTMTWTAVVCNKVVTSSLNTTNPYSASVTFTYSMVGGGGGGGLYYQSKSATGGGGGSSALIKGGALLAYAAGGTGGAASTSAAYATGSSGSTVSGSFSLSSGEAFVAYVGGGGGTGFWCGGGGASGYFGGGGGIAYGSAGSTTGGGGGGSNVGGSSSGGTAGSSLAGGRGRASGCPTYAYPGYGGSGATGGAGGEGDGAGSGGGGGGFGSGGGSYLSTKASAGGSNGGNGAGSYGGIGSNTWATSITLPAAAGLGGEGGNNTFSGGNGGLIILKHFSPTGTCSF